MANYGYKGWIKLWREEMHNPLYSEEPFTKWQAWIDLCMRADDNGTVKTSLEALKNQWLWGSKGKVTRYLRTLSETGFVTVYGTPNKGTLIRINTEISGSSSKQNGTVYRTKRKPKTGTGEFTSKEVGVHASFQLSVTPEDKEVKNKYNELMEDLGDEYE